MEVVEIHALDKLDLPLYSMDKINCEDDGLYCWTCSIRKIIEKEIERESTKDTGIGEFQVQTCTLDELESLIY